MLIYPIKHDAARNGRLSVEPYLTIYDLALEYDGITSVQIAEIMGTSVCNAKRLLYRMVYTGALIARGRIGKRVLYLPGCAAGCKKIIGLAIVHTMRWVDYAAASNPPGSGAML